LATQRKRALSFLGARTEIKFSGQDVHRYFGSESGFGDLVSQFKGRRSMNPQNTPVPSTATDESARGGGGTESRGTLAETKDKLTQTARNAAAKVKSTASDTAAKAKDQAERVVSEQKETAATRLGDYSSAIHESAKSLEEKDPNIAWFTHRAADRLQSVSEYVRTRDFDGLRVDAERVARRHPAVFFGGMFLGGLLIGNLVKASRRKVETNDNRYSDESGELGASEAGADWMSSASTPPSASSPQSASGLSATGGQCDIPTSAPGTGI
jgi:hypothetical protein